MAKSFIVDPKNNVHIQTIYPHCGPSRLKPEAIHKAVNRTVSAMEKAVYTAAVTTTMAAMTATVYVTLGSPYTVAFVVGTLIASLETTFPKTSQSDIHTTPSIRTKAFSYIAQAVYTAAILTTAKVMIYACIALGPLAIVSALFIGGAILSGIMTAHKNVEKQN